MLPEINSQSTRRAGGGAHLRAAEVSNPEHELQDAVAPGDDGRVRDRNRTAPVLGVRQARKDDALHRTNFALGTPCGKTAPGRRLEEAASWGFCARAYYSHKQLCGCQRRQESPCWAPALEGKRCGGCTRMTASRKMPQMLCTATTTMPPQQSFGDCAQAPLSAQPQAHQRAQQ